METATQHGLLLSRGNPPVSVAVVRHVAVQARLFAVVLRCLPTSILGDADQGAILRQDRIAQLRETFSKVRIKAVLLRHDTPVIAVPQMDVQLTAITDINIVLLEALSPAIGHLSAQVISQGFQFHGRQSILHLAFHHRPELSLPLLRGEQGGADLLVHGVVLAVPVHDAPFRLLRLPFPDQGRQDLILIAPELFPVKRFALPAHIAVLIGCEQICCHGGVQLQRLEGRGQDGKPVLTQHEAEAPAIVPLDVEGADVVDALQRPHGTRLHRAVGVLHLLKLDPASHRELLAQKVQPLF